MNVEDTIKEAMREYPSLFVFRSDVLDQLFYVIGNGYAWENGELVRPPSRDRFDERRFGVVLWQEYLNFVVRTNIETLAAPEENGIFWSMYPESIHSYVNNIPEDITPDWAAAAEEARAIGERTRARLQQRARSLGIEYPTKTNRDWYTLHEYDLSTNSYNIMRYVRAHELTGTALPTHPQALPWGFKKHLEAKEANK